MKRDESQGGELMKGTGSSYKEDEVERGGEKGEMEEIASPV